MNEDEVHEFELSWYRSKIKKIPPLLKASYIYRPNNYLVLDPIQNGPLFNELGLTQNAFIELGQHLTMEQWVKVRQMQQQRRRQKLEFWWMENMVMHRRTLRFFPVCMQRYTTRWSYIRSLHVYFPS